MFQVLNPVLIEAPCSLHIFLFAILCKHQAVKEDNCTSKRYILVIHQASKEHRECFHIYHGSYSMQPCVVGGCWWAGKSQPCPSRRKRRNNRQQQEKGRRRRRRWGGGMIGRSISRKEELLVVIKGGGREGASARKTQWNCKSVWMKTL